MKTTTRLFSRQTQVLGTWSQLSAPEAIDILAAAGFDFTIVDAEHGSFGMEAIETLVRACDAGGVVPLVRVPSLDQAQITRAFDAGAHAVVVPGVSSVAEARRAVEAGRFAPHGSRGACPCVRAGGHWVDDWRTYAEASERDTGIVVLAETPGALADIEGICAVDRIRALMIGPFDLSVALGLQGDSRHPDVVAAIRRMVAAAGRRALPVILPIFAPDLAETRRQIESWQADGVRMFTVGTDKILLHSQARRFVDALRT